MSRRLERAARTDIYRLIGWQALVALIMAALWLFMSLKAAYSGLLGGLICVAANGYFASKSFSHLSASAAGRMLWNFYAGEFIKLLFTAFAFFIAIKYVAVAILPFFVTYLVVQLALYLGVLLVK